VRSSCPAFAVVPVASAEEVSTSTV
jgi:hypothetical protein